MSLAHSVYHSSNGVANALRVTHLLSTLGGVELAAVVANHLPVPQHTALGLTQALSANSSTCRQDLGAMKAAVAEFSGPQAEIAGLLA